MINKSLKYLVIVFLNALLLAVLLFLWTDKLELVFNLEVRPKEFIKIIVFSIIALIAIRILISYFRNKKIVAISFKLKAAVLATLLVSSYLYVDYTVKIIGHTIINRKIRTQASAKIKESNGLANGTRADNLTNEEYQQITKINWFPKLPIEAFNIKYVYEYDGFLPDYLFNLTYDLPAQMKVDTIGITEEKFEKYQSFTTVNNIKTVTYSEGIH